MEFSNISRKEDGTDADVPLIYKSADGSTDLLPTTAIPKWRVWKNHLAICSAFLFTFTAYQSLQNLQTSLN
ncbi:Hypp2934 [Branchiostoma lanceolatum]|uniref:Hypp2934 protein n=1 Tax=Branchiostoma lanceolatum TaxID=7740 RepID=A0A8J9ZWW1_BRALA|nr:Hypp2934 [Branchiostoma lanceolatum]